MSSRLGPVLLLAVLTMGLVLSALLADAWIVLRTPLAVPPGGLVYEVGPGTGLIRIAGDLESRGLMRRARYLVWYARWRGVSTIQAGRYRIPRGMTPLGFLDRLRRGDVIQYALTVPEGIRFRELMARLAAHPAIDHRLSGETPEAIMRRLGHAGQAAEGRFLPETYFFPAGTTDLAFLQRAYAAMQAVLDEEWRGRAPGLPYHGPDEALVMASIIEKETGRADERPIIAGVFVRRLERHMRLQSDPTVIYGLGGRYEGRLRRRDLRADTPYNTYRHRGLPPTPIALPGRAAIHAALHPAAGKALYFVARGDGRHVFSDDLRSHERAVSRYQRGQP